MSVLREIGNLIAHGGQFSPRWGWHDDHRAVDGTPEYLPALQQVRGEFEELLEVLRATPDVLGGRCLQLGLGECSASHQVWRVLFSKVVTLDWGAVMYDDNLSPLLGVDTSDPTSISLAASLGGAPYDFLFIDAGHSEEDARRDHLWYGPLVRPGGIIAFHDALRRPGFEDAVQVWKYLETLQQPVNMIGDEVGVAWVYHSK